MPNGRNTTPFNRSSDASDGSSLEPIACRCENQQSHWGWDGIPYDDLPELCRKTVGKLPNCLESDEKLTSGNEAEEDKSASAEAEEDVDNSTSEEAEEDITAPESDPDCEWDPKWQYCRNSEGTKLVNTEKISPVEDKHTRGAENTPSTNSRKRIRLDKRNSDTWTIKKCKKRTDIHIKFRHGEKQSKVKISVEFST